MVSFKTTLKSVGVILICFCTIFLATLFVSYRYELTRIDVNILDAYQKAMYDGKLTTCNMMIIISGCVVGLFSFILLFFSIERYINENKGNMGVLKALGYSNKHISSYFLKFSLPVLIGSILGYLGAILFSKIFFDAMNKDFNCNQEIAFHFNIVIFLILVLVLPLITLGFSYLIARLKLKANPLDMINNRSKKKTSRRIKNKKSFLNEIRITMLKNNILLIAFVAFSTFCFSANIQMAFTLKFQAKADDLFFWMILLIGLILGITIMLLSFRFVFKSNLKYMSILKAYGYSNRECYYAMYGGYYIVALLSFLFGTGYMAMIMSITFKAFSNDSFGISYNFDWQAMGIAFAIFVVVYLVINIYYYLKISKLKLDHLNADLC